VTETRGVVTDLEVQQLLVECGFKSAVRLTMTSCRWSLLGEVAGGLQLRIDCMNGARGGYVLLVASESERLILVDMLAQNGIRAVDVRAEQIDRAAAPWLALSVGVSALALFGWVLSSIRPFFP
jgi:hypothetical protein